LDGSSTDGYDARADGSNFKPLFNMREEGIAKLMDAIYKSQVLHARPRPVIIDHLSASVAMNFMITRERPLESNGCSRNERYGAPAKTWGSITCAP